MPGGWRDAEATAEATAATAAKEKVLDRKSVV
jgi:hypothetical protein